MKLQTHLKIDPRYSGEVVALEKGYAKVELFTQDFMAADDEGLVHGGFTFSAADFVAMAAVNEPYGVLGAADVKFLAPVVVGDKIVFEAHVVENNGKKTQVKVEGAVEGKKVFEGLFTTYTLDSHILSKR